MLWCSDITYNVVVAGGIVYLAIVMDMFIRAIRGWELGRDQTVDVVIYTLWRAEAQRTTGPLLRQTRMGRNRQAMSQV